MKLLALLFFVGVASASFYDVLDDAADEIVRDFLVGMEPSLKDTLELTNRQAAEEEVDEEIKTELGKKLREALDHILEHIKDAMDKGKTLKEDYINKAKEIKEKLKELHQDLGEKAKELYQKIKEKAKNFLKELLDKLGLNKDKEERSADEAQAAITFLKDTFRKFKEALLSKIDKEALKEKVEKLFGKGSELADQFLTLLKEKGEAGKQKLLALIDRILGETEEEEVREERSVAELWEKVKNYFKELQIDLKEKYLKFGEWVKEHIGKGLDATKTKLENIKKIARELRDHAKDVSKEVAVEAIEFLRPYKEDMGSLWEQVKDTVKDILNRKD